MTVGHVLLWLAALGLTVVAVYDGRFGHALIMMLVVVLMSTAF